MIKHNSLLALSLCLTLVTGAYADVAPAATAAPAAGKSPWTFESSLTTRASYDTNIYNAGKGPLANQSAFVLTVAPTLKATYKLPAADAKAAASSLAFTYTPTGTLYAKGGSLDYLNQNFSAEQKFKAFDFDWALKESLVWVTGQNGMPIYADDAGATYSPGFTAPSEQARTNMLVWSESFNVNKKIDNWLVEFVGKGTYFDYQSRQTPTTGYLNCTDRFDTNAGFNVGYKTYKDIYLLAGYRLGYQWQGVNPVKTQQYGSLYNRFLVGVRGTPIENLTIDFLVGPDFRTFKKLVAAGFDTSNTYLYFEGTATYKPTKVDTLSATFSRNITMASTGGCAYEDIVTNFKYARVLNSEFSGEVALNILQRPYMPGISDTTARYVLYSPAFGLNYTPKGNWAYRLAWAFNTAQTDTAGVSAKPDYQEFRQNVYSIEAKYKF